MYEVIQSFHTLISSADKGKALYKRAFSEDHDIRPSKQVPFVSDNLNGANRVYSSESLHQDTETPPVIGQRRSVSFTLTNSEFSLDVDADPGRLNLFSECNASSISTVFNRAPSVVTYGCCEWDDSFRVCTATRDRDIGQGSLDKEIPVAKGDDSAVASSYAANSVIDKTQSTMFRVVTIPGQTVVDLVQHWGSAQGCETPAFVSVDAGGKKRQINRREVSDCASRFAHRLKNLGIGKGSIVCNALPNSIERVICEFGIQFAGAASINGQILRSDGEDFKDALRTSRCSAVIVDPHVRNGARHILLHDVPFGQENSVQSKDLPDLKNLIVCSRDESSPDNDFITLLKNPQLSQFVADVSPSDLATVMTTSGSTGYSKLVKLSHANICHFGKQVKGIEPFSPGDHFMNCAPLGWAGGFPQWYLSCGVTRYFLDMHDGPIPDLPATIWNVIVQEKIIYGFLSPMYVNAILTNSPWQTAAWKPRILCLAGQPVKKGLLEIIGKLCDNVDINYGMTECNLVTTHRIQDPSTYIDGCGGYPGYGVNIKVVDKDRKEVPQGTTGEILMWSPALCSGYLNNESASMAAFTSDGWFCTDDTGYMGQDGKMYIEGRQSDSILRGAYILYPGWLEKKMREFPGVKDITVVAVPDKVLHNEICACVVTSNVQGVVVGSLNEKMISHGNVDDAVSSSSSSLDKTSRDEVDNIAFVQNHKHLNNSVSNSVPTPKSRETNSEIDEYGSLKNFDAIRMQGANKPLSVPFNETKIKHGNIVSSQINSNRVVDHSTECADLLKFEQELRDYTSGLQLLHEKDAMRMVPKYYVFMDQFPLTSTGKTSRKEIRKIAAEVLGLAD